MSITAPLLKNEEGIIRNVLICHLARSRAPVPTTRLVEFGKSLWGPEADVEEIMSEMYLRELIEFALDDDGNPLGIQLTSRADGLKIQSQQYLAERMLEALPTEDYDCV